MTGGTQSVKHRRAASLLAAGAVGVVLLGGAAACASTGKSVSVSAGGSYSASATATAGSASPSASAAGSTSATAGASPSTSLKMGGGSTFPAGSVGVTPNAQLSTAPSGAKYTPFLTAAHSADGRTLYVTLESQGGACGQYDVVVQESSGTVSVGLVHLPSGGRICPMFMARTAVPAKLATPLDGRRVIDLANGQTVGSAQIG